MGNVAFLSMNVYKLGHWHMVDVLIYLVWISIP